MYNNTRVILCNSMQGEDYQIENWFINTDELSYTSDKV